MLPSLVEAVGRTPLVRLARTDARFGEGITLWAKLEWFNPGGSVKDRAARQMLTEALADGRLKPGGTVIDSTSGNTGIAYSWLCAALGLKCVLVMPENVTHGRKAFTRTLGAEIVYSDPLEGSDGAILKAQALVRAEPDRRFYPDQYSNPANPRAHELGTAREIWAQTGGAVTHFVAGIGTTGTVMGTGRGLKALSPSVQVLAVEPDDGLHGLEGLKHLASSIRPAIWQPEGVVDEILPIGTEAGWDESERLLREEGLAVGHSGGAALAGALRVAQRLHEAGEPGTIVTLFPDRADRYFEAGVWDPSQTW
ncbi:MAG: cysteine synthase family protein [Deltaproteobacteria bacterium]|nr:cysteine synthase family protein [Deltaproteobacteria bacterium]